MKQWERWWQSYQSRFKVNKKYEDSSITKDSSVLLTERLAFFLPKVSDKTTLLEGVIYLVLWALFITSIQLQSFTSLKGFLTVFLAQLITVLLTVIPSVYLVDLQRDSLQSISIFQVCIRIIILTMVMGVFAVLVGLSLLSFFDLITLTVPLILFEVVVHVLSIGGFTALILMYHLRRYKELRTYYIEAQQQLNTKNSHIKARLAPHFFFNTINSLTSLIETDKEQALDLLQHLSHLFRSSFNEPIEINFEEELELSHHYLAIEKYRLRDKLQINWSLPDDDLIYDMSITSLTLQSVLEQTILHVVEMSTTPVHISISVIWENHTVIIEVQAQAQKDRILVAHGIHNTLGHKLNFITEQQRLRRHFGDSASITSVIDEQQVTNTIRYPLHDAFS